MTVGRSPRGLAYDGTYVWVANYNDNTVSKVNASTGAVVGTYAVGSGPVAVVFDGAYIWVANNSANTLSKLNPGSGSAVGT